MINELVQAAFERNQKDLTLPNVQIIWAGASVMLFFPATRPLSFGGDPDAVYKADKNAVANIKSFCVANDARCGQIKGRPDLPLNV